MKNKLHRHLVTCRLCQLEQGHYCPALSEKTAQGMRERAKTDPVGFADAVDIAASRAKARDEIIAIKDRCRAAGISESNVRKIRKDYGISAADALEIAIVRKSTREARNGK